MFVIGVTGGIGSGKSTVARMLSRRGVKVFDADAMVAAALKPGGEAYSAVVRAFGHTILAGARIDKKKLADVVFSSDDKRRKLEGILHNILEKTIKRELKQLRSAGRKATVIDAPLLIEAGWDQWCDFVVVVRSNRDLQLKRVLAAGKMSKQDFFRRLKKQMPAAEKMQRADSIIDNRGTVKKTKNQVEELWQGLQRRITK